MKITSISYTHTYQIGLAQWDDLVYETCPECNGAGYMFYSCCTGEALNGGWEDIQMCPVCKEHLGEEPCNTCEGTVKILREIESE